VTANVTIQIPAVGYSQTLVVPANTVQTSATIPKSGSQDARLTAGGLYNTGIHITSDQPVVAYAHIYASSVSGATLLFPTNTLGSDYYSLNFTQTSNEVNSNSWFCVVATEDNTTVEITPSVATTDSKLTAGSPTTFLLNKGQVYNVMATTSGNNGGDLTGSRIRSVASASGACKRIAVFSGSGKINIGCTSGTADNLYQQVFPKSVWGKKYLTVPTSTLPNNYFRVAVSDPTTVVKWNGSVITGLVAGFYYEFLTKQPGVIESDKPIMVAQYISSQGCLNNGTPGDPEMIYLSPVEQTINKVVLNSTPNYKITGHYINVVIKASGVNNFTLDGVNRASSFIAHPQDATYMYAQFTGLSAGQHTLASDSGFNAIAYGFGSAESYGYNAGTNLKDLYQYISIDNKYATVNYPAGCKASPLRFAMTFPYQPTEIDWHFNG
ncbi:MAG TPA: IgGFc-binding protein, partial [Chitinophagaceae bacterium]|nr:IgGFc-binding protein [Chitinophagaceae bacterium]